eukprot:scaffold305737_cov28-Tisochrysis_lutea.AAC.1
MVLAASPFSERHTGVAIDRKTREACVEAGLSSDVFSTVFFPVSDNASNMKNGWASFGRGPCCVHTVQLRAQYRGTDSTRKFATIVLPWMERFAAMGPRAETFLSILSARRLQKTLVAPGPP